jgi:hypothetical protein
LTSAWLGVASAGAQAAPEPRPAQPDVQRPEYQVTGFRSAHFGMTREQLVRAIRSDFHLRSSDIHALTNTADGTLALVAKVGALQPGPGEATVTYILGKSAKRLIHVNVVWLMRGGVGSAEREVVSAAGRKLADYFAGHRWAAGTQFRDVPVAANSVVMFEGHDADGRAVEVRADGVDYVRMTKDGAKASPPAKGGVRLRVAYSADAAKPDVAHIGAKQF